MPIKFFDMFAGIGGFRSGLEAVSGFECVGYCEIDKYAKQAYEAMYDTKGELYFDDARKINPESLPDIDLICGGFPCQSFSIAGERRGFEDVRGTLPIKDLSICSLRTYSDCLTITKAGRFKQSSLHWMNWGMMSCGKCVTAKISEFPSQERECILSDIIERNVEAKYYLSLKQIQKLLYKGYQAKKENAYIQLMGLALL